MRLTPDHGTDIEALLGFLGSKSLDYHDVQTLDAGQAALDRWPLLARLRLNPEDPPVRTEPSP